MNFVHLKTHFVRFLFSFVLFRIYLDNWFSLTIQVERATCRSGSHGRASQWLYLDLVHAMACHPLLFIPRQSSPYADWRYRLPYKVCWGCSEVLPRQRMFHRIKTEYLWTHSGFDYLSRALSVFHKLSRSLCLWRNAPSAPDSVRSISCVLKGSRGLSTKQLCFGFLGELDVDG